MAQVVNIWRELDTSQRVVYVVGGVVVAAVTTVVLKRLLHTEKKIYPRDTVILHQVGRGPFAPSLTPFAIKLETYLRMAKIPYLNVHDMTKSSKGKFPWMEYNGEAVADSTLCIDFLKDKLNIDLNRHLSNTERGIAHSMQVMAEEHFYWIWGLIRWGYDNDKSILSKSLKFSKFVLWIMKRQVRKMLWAQGLGRHSVQETYLMMKKDLKSFSDFIGSKKFLMGDVPCEEDCAVFGQLCQLHYQLMIKGQENIVRDDYPNLAAYCERMKTTFWPDWDQCITHGGTREATK